MRRKNHYGWGLSEPVNTIFISGAREVAEFMPKAGGMILNEAKFDKISPALDVQA
jgi:hypothetical protein